MNVYVIGSMKSMEEGFNPRELDAVSLLEHDIKLTEIKNIELVGNDIYCYTSQTVPLYIARLKTPEQAKQYYNEFINVWHMWQIPF